jgi:hypothetical protein
LLAQVNIPIQTPNSQRHACSSDSVPLLLPTFKQSEKERRGEELPATAMGREAEARRRWTLVLVNLASVLEKADEVLLPAVYREVGAELGVSPTALGSLTLCRAIVQAASYPLAAYASARHDRARVIAVGAFLWAAATLLVAVSGSFLQVTSSPLADCGTHSTFPVLHAPTPI